MDNQNVINFLNQLLSNQFVLYVKLHRYSWFVQGRHFFQLRDLFSFMYHQTEKELDKVAERILMVDGKPLATMSKYTKEATLEEATSDNKEKEIIAQLIKDYKQIIGEISTEGIPLAQERNDRPTVDLLTTLQSGYEKYKWMLHAYCGLDS